MSADMRRPTELRTKTEPRKQPARRRPLLTLALLSLIGGCAEAPLTTSGSLSSYEAMAPAKGVLTQATIKADKSTLRKAKTVRIVPTLVVGYALQAQITAEQRALVANAVDRAMCLNLERGFEVVEVQKPADLTVRAFVTYLAPTNVVSAGASSVFGVGSSVAAAVVHAPIPAPRLPIGLGGLSIEAEARSAELQQAAAMTWARGADSLTVHARIAEEGDAYELSNDFGADFAKLMISGEDPFAVAMPNLPDAQSVVEFLGGEPKSPGCKAFGKSPGLGGLLARQFGAPPSLTDAGKTTPNP